MYGTWTDSGGNLDSNPLFVSDQNNDFRLQPTSPMINAGTTAVPDPPGLPTTDFQGNPRVMGPAPDIGAYESFPVNPQEGTIGTEIAITGSGYGSKKGKVLVGTASLKILEWTDTRIRGLLSKVPSSGPDTYDVTIRPPKASAIVLPNSFTVRALAIDYVDPTSGSVGARLLYLAISSERRRERLLWEERAVRSPVGQWAARMGSVRSFLSFPKVLAREPKSLK